MSAERIPDDAPAAALFPEYETLYDLIAQEVEGLTDEQLDWTSDKWGWAEWSIRRQMSHMASLLYRWMAVRWADTLFPDGNHGVEDVEGIAVSDNDRALDVRYHDMDVILAILREGIEMGASDTVRAHGRLPAQQHAGHRVQPGARPRRQRPSPWHHIGR